MCAHSSIGHAMLKQSQDKTHLHACERKNSTVWASKFTFSKLCGGFSFLMPIFLFQTSFADGFTIQTDRQ